MTPREIAQARLEGRARRIRLIRRRIVGGAVGLFSAVWAVLGIQLATGHDPALANKSTTTTSSQTSDTSASNSSSPASSSNSSSQSSGSSSQSAAPVTTRQS